MHAVPDRSDADCHALALGVDDLVRAVAHRASTHASSSFDDLMQDGRLGALEAARAFREDLGTPFRTFAYLRIRGAMVDGQRRMDVVGRRNNDFNRAAQAPISLNAPVNQHNVFVSDEPELGDQIVCPAPGPEHVVAEQDEQDRLRALVFDSALLNDRERETVAETFWGGRTLAEIGHGWGLTESRACQIRSRALLKLRQHLERAAA